MPSFVQTLINTCMHTYIPYQTIHTYIHTYIHTWQLQSQSESNDDGDGNGDDIPSPLWKVFGRSEVEEVLHRAGLKIVSRLPTAFASPFDEMDNYDLKKYQSHGCLCLFSYCHDTNMHICINIHTFYIW